MCAEPEPTLTLADAQALAVEYAPALFFHPLDEFSLSSVNDTFADPSQGRILRTDGENEPILISDTLDLEVLFQESQGGASSGILFFEHDRTEEYVRGAGFDEAGLSRAPIYWNVFDSGNNSWTFNYFFYYTFSGPLTLSVASNLGNAETGYTQSVVDPYAQHEGDWEGLSVVVCKSLTPSQPVGMVYQQHSFNQHLDCTQGECVFFRDTFHAVGFSAMNNHATYPVSAQNIISFPPIQIPGFDLLRGALVVDRTVYADANGNYRYFFPNDDNLIFHQDPEDLEIGVTDTSLLWQGYTGEWGRDGNHPPVDFNATVYCLDEMQVTITDCPTAAEDLAFNLAMQVLNVFEPTEETRLFVQVVQAQLGATLDQLTGDSSDGPIRKSYFGVIDDAQNADLWTEGTPPNTTAEELCSIITITGGAAEVTPEPATESPSASPSASILQVPSTAPSTAPIAPQPLPLPLRQVQPGAAFTVFCCFRCPLSTWHFLFSVLSDLSASRYIRSYSSIASYRNSNIIQDIHCLRTHTQPSPIHSASRTFLLPLAEYDVSPSIRHPCKPDQRPKVVYWSE